MARPSVKAERTEAILQAYERCVARLGVEGATLEKIAAEAGMARPLLRHHAGNRDELLRMAVRRFAGRSDQAMRELRSALPEGATGRDLLELILPPKNPEAFSSDVMIAAAFIYAAQTDEFLRQTMQSWLENFLGSFGVRRPGDLSAGRLCHGAMRDRGYQRNLVQRGFARGAWCESIAARAFASGGAGADAKSGIRNANGRRQSMNFLEHRFSDQTLNDWESMLGEYGVMFGLVCFVLELIRYGFQGRLRWMLIGDAAANFVTQFLYVLSLILIAGLYLSVFHSVYPQYSLLQLPTNWWTIALCVLLADFAYYWEHRFSHRTGIGSATHTVHHSSPEYNISVAYRHGPLDAVFGIPFLLPLAVIGFSPVLIFFAASFVQLYQTWLHTEAVRKLPAWFEAVFNTPSHHRVHHGSNPQYLDRNYGGILILWDRIFGTFEAESEPVVFGVLPPLGSVNPLRVWLHGFSRLWRRAREAPGAGRRWLSLILPPDADLGPKIRIEAHDRRPNPSPPAGPC